MLTTIYILQVGYVVVNGRGLNLVPGTYADVEEEDARRLVREGAAYLADEKGVINDSKVGIKHSASIPGDNNGRDEGTPKSRRKRRRHNNRGNGKRSDSKT